VAVRNPKPGAGVCNTFTLSSKGGGTIQVQFQFGARSYEAILQAMIQNDRNVAIATMSKLVAQELASEDARDAKAAHAGRSQILKVAEERQRNADGTEEAIASIVCDKVREIIQTIEAGEQPKPKA